MTGQNPPEPQMAKPGEEDTAALAAVGVSRSVFETSFGIVEQVSTRAEYLRGYIKARRRQRRAELIQLLGGCCVRCGSTEDLVFDHIDPATKAFAIGGCMSRAWDELVAEALKCQLLCMPCHVEKGAEDRPEPAHSYYRYWYYGCRCSICRRANADKSARLREAKISRKRRESVEMTEQSHASNP